MNAVAIAPGAERLVSTRWLAEHMKDSDVRIVDVRATRSDASGPRLRADLPRFVELGPRAGWARSGHWPRGGDDPPRTFLEGHVPGATSFDVGRRLFDNDGALVSALELAMVMSEAGIGDEHSVVLVDDRTPNAALVLAWALRRYGHDARILDGGFPRWLGEGRPVSREVRRHPFASFTARRAS